MARSLIAADVRLRPGRYVVESDEPVALQGTAYRWRQELDIVAGREAVLDLTIANAVRNGSIDTVRRRSCRPCRGLQVRVASFIPWACAHG